MHLRICQQKKDISEKVTKLRVFCVSNQSDNNDEPIAALCAHTHWLVRRTKPVFIHTIKTHKRMHNDRDAHVRLCKRCVLAPFSFSSSLVTVDLKSLSLKLKSNTQLTYIQTVAEF